MENKFIKAELERMYAGASRRSAEQRENDERRRNIAALANFTSNLFSVLGNPGATSLQSPAGNRSSSFQRYTSSMKDFNGSIAGGMFRSRFSPGKALGSGRNIRTI